MQASYTIAFDDLEFGVYESLTACEVAQAVLKLTADIPGVADTERESANYPLHGDDRRHGVLVMQPRQANAAARLIFTCHKLNAVHNILIAAHAQPRFQASTQLALKSVLALCVAGIPWKIYASTEAVTCHITSLDLQFPEVNPMVQGQQLGLGHVEVHCTNTTAHPRQVDLAVVSETTGHTLRARPRNADSMHLRLYIDPARTQGLGHSASDQQALSAVVWVKGHSASTQKLPIYAAFELTTLMAAGSYNGEIPLKLFYQSSR